MNRADQPQKNRILIVDDNDGIHKDFRKIFDLMRRKPGEIDSLENSLFDKAPQREPLDIEVDSAFQGEEGYHMVRKAVLSGNPYALAFVDARMPPGWNGIETVERIWGVDEEIEIVICTAYSDHSWGEISERLGVNTDRLLVLKKPFDPIEVQQIVTSLLKKRQLRLESRAKQQELEDLVSIRTKELRQVQEQCRLTLEKMQKMQKMLRSNKKS